MTTKNQATHATATADRAALAYKGIVALALALDATKLDYFNADVPFAVSVVLAKAPRLLALRADFVKLHDFDIANLDGLESYALALSFCQARCNSESASPAALKKLKAEALKLRKVLKRDAATQVDRELFESDSLGKLSGNSSYRGVAGDLGSLSVLYRTHAAKLAGNTAVTAADLTRAGELSLQLLTAAGLHESADTPSAIELALDLRRVFTLLNRAYNEVRAATAYLRRNKGDADQLAPSLFARRGRKSKGADKTAKPAPDATPAAPAAEKAAP